MREEDNMDYDEFPEKGPALKIEWWDGFGFHVTQEYDLHDETVYSVASAMRTALLGMGFQPGNVDEIFQEEL